MSEAIINTVSNSVILRIKLWITKVSELKEFLPLLILKFCVSFNYTVLAAMKDTLVVTAKGSGAEVIPVLKGGVVLLFAFAVMLIYAKLSNILSQQKLFYVILLFFAGFFLIYGFILFPYKDIISPNKSADWLLEIIGNHHKHWVAVYRNWIHALFFILAELWGGIMINLLFWGLANQITSIKNAAKFYIFYTAGGQFGTVLAGFITYYYSTLKSKDFTSIIAKLMIIVLLVCIIIALAYWWADRYIISSKGKESINSNDSTNNKTKLCLKESLIFILRSKYLGLIALMVIGYGISINMVEVCWKAILKIQFPNAVDYQAYMGLVQTILGIVSFIVALFVGGKVIRNYGWYTSAKLTPIVLAITTGLFFIGYFLFPNYAVNRTALISFIIPFEDLGFIQYFFHMKSIKVSINALELLVLFGTIHGIACKTMKYCLFDPTKEMAYIPLDQESQVKGKAAVDLVGARFGKSGSSWAQLALIDLVGAGSILDVMNLLFPCILGVLGFWFVAVKKLNNKLMRFHTNI